MMNSFSGKSNVLSREVVSSCPSPLRRLLYSMGLEEAARPSSSRCTARQRFFLFRYYRHLLQSMLIFEVRMYAESSYRRMRNPAKIYPVDTDLCKRVTSADFGRLLENVVFLEMRRRGYEIFYFSEARECDFVVKTGQN